MPSGKQHNYLNQTMLIILAGLVMFLDFAPETRVLHWFRLLGMMIGINYFGPDLDKNGTFPDQNYGMFHIIWDGYAWIFPHRGSSHAWLGILTRLLYIIPLLIAIYVKHSFWIQYNQSKIFAIFQGIVIADLLHILADKMFSRSKSR